MAEMVKIKDSKENQDVLEKAQPGDMIEFVRGTYSHWAIYIGNGLVIHRWGENDGIGQSVGLRGNLMTVFGAEFNKAKISETKMLDVLKYGGTVRVNNYLDIKWKPLASDVIIVKAREAIDIEGYNLIYNNCEHFATECRYGQPNCRQVQMVVGSSLAAGLLITAITAFAAYMLSGSSDKGGEEEEVEEKNTKIKAIEMKLNKH